MRRPPKSWNLAQRIILVIATAQTLTLIAHWIFYQSPEGGWFGYGPQTGGGTLSWDPGNFSLFHDAATGIGTVGFIAVWAAISFWLLTDRNENE